MEREVGGGIGTGNTCKPMAVSFQCMTKYKKKKKSVLVNRNQIKQSIRKKNKIKSLFSSKKKKKKKSVLILTKSNIN